MIVELPTISAFTNPDELMVATIGLLLVHVPPNVPSDNVVVPPEQRAVTPMIAPGV